jgi:hypothetical protein
MQEYSVLSSYELSDDLCDDYLLATDTQIRLGLYSEAWYATTACERFPHQSKRYVSLFDLVIDERGAHFVVQNLKNLTVLGISKFWGDLGNNNIGDLGASTIANDLKNLNDFGISKQWSDLDNNNVGDLDATAIAKGLKNLTKLSIGIHWSNSDSNKVGHSGAAAIANSLKDLT